ncbi:MAG: Hpt domain-containing protein [Magnetococcales bacterium]|nr:Hpt domain-containing protein [Magnetococcales bacterium]
MSLKRALANHQFAFAFPAQLPLGGRTARSEERIEASLLSRSLTRMPPQEDQEAGRRRVMGHFRENRSLSGLSRRDLKRAPWFLFAAGEDGLVPAEDPAFLSAWVGWFEKNPASGTLADLLHNLLLHDPRGPCRALLKQGIERHLARSVQPHLVAWRERCVRFKLLEEEGPEAFAAMLYRGEGTFLELTRQAGLTGDLVSRGFVQRSLGHLLKRLRGYADADGLRVEELQALLNGFRDQQGRFQQLVAGFASQLAEVLLRPFQDREAEGRLRQLLRDFLVKYLGDPRTHPAAWNAVDPKAREVILGWLSGRPRHIDDKLWLFVQEANKQLAELETELFNLKNQGKTTPAGVLHRAIQRLHSVEGVAEFFGLSDVIDLCQEMEEVLGRMRDGRLEPDTEKVAWLLTRQELLRDRVNDVPGFSFHKSAPG